MHVLLWCRRHCRLLWKGDRSFIPGKKKKPFARTLVALLQILIFVATCFYLCRPAQYVTLEFKLEWLFGVIQPLTINTL